MAHDVIMPQMGESIAEGTISTWLKKVGDTVAKDEPLFEISTDKVDAEIPAPAAGVLVEIKVEPGQTVPINTVVAVIAEAVAVAPAAQPQADGDARTAAPSGAMGARQSAGSKPDDTGPHASVGSPAAQSVQRGQALDPPPQPQTPPAAGSQPSDAAARGPAHPHKSSPLVRRMAAAHDVDLGQVEGSGIGGRITKQDMQRAIDAGPDDATARSDRAASGPPPAPAAGSSHTTPAPAGVAPSLAHNQALRGVPHAGPEAGLDAIPEPYRPRALAGDRVEELAGMRQKIAAHMVISKRISPHVATVWEVDFSHICKLRARYKATWQERHGVNLTYTAFIIKACVDALKAFAPLNASTDGKQVIYHAQVNLGLAVALDWGLLVPVIHGADELNLLGLARRAADLAARARSKKLKPHEVQGGTFTVSNPGSFGPMFNVPIINQPQVGILGVGTVEKRPVVIDDMLAIRTRAYLSMSFDHRLVDGAVADQFMAHLKHSLEHFDDAGL